MGGSSGVLFVCVSVRICGCVLLTSIVDDFSAQDRCHLQHSDEGFVHGGERERGHAVSPSHLSDVHCAVT